MVVLPPRAADRENALGFGVHVNHLAAFQRADIERVRAQKANLLVNGKYGFHTGMCDVIGIENGQRHRNSDAVVTTQRGALGTDEVSIDFQIQPFLVHILGAARLFFAYHVQMTLQNDGFRLFVTGRGLFDDNDIVVGVLMVFQIALACESRAPVADGLGVAGTMRDGAHLLKKTEYAFGF